MAAFNIIQFLLIALGFAYSIRRIRKYRSIVFEVRRGEKCFGCSSDIEGAKRSFEIDPDENKMSLCLSCKREERIDSFISLFSLKSMLNRFKKFLFSKRSDKVVFYFLICIILGIFCELFLRIYFGVKTIWIVPTILNIAYWALFCYKSKITYIKE